MDDHLFQPTLMFGIWPMSAGETDPPWVIFRHRDDAEHWIETEKFVGQCQILPCTVQGVRSVKP